jgi:hypothetical protein
LSKVTAKVRGDAADHRDAAQWEFYVVPAASLPAQKTISLSKVKKLARPISISEVAEEIDRLACEPAKRPPVPAMDR